MWRPLGLALPLLASCAIPAPPPPETARAVVVEGYTGGCELCAPLLHKGERTVTCESVAVDKEPLWRRATYYSATVCFIGGGP